MTSVLLIDLTGIFELKVQSLKNNAWNLCENNNEKKIKNIYVLQQVDVFHFSYLHDLVFFFERANFCLA